MSSTLIYSQIFWVNIALCSFLLLLLVHLFCFLMLRTKKQISFAAPPLSLSSFVPIKPDVRGS